MGKQKGPTCSMQGYITFWIYFLTISQRELLVLSGWKSVGLDYLIRDQEKVLFYYFWT